MEEASSSRLHTAGCNSIKGVCCCTSCDSCENGLSGVSTSRVFRAIVAHLGCVDASESVGACFVSLASRAILLWLQFYAHSTGYGRTIQTLSSMSEGRQCPRRQLADFAGK
jgi:hypothetical protein